MTSLPWMPFYVADYLADTGHLSTTEHGAYLLLIMHYWQTGRLPEDDASLARIARLRPEHWGKIRHQLEGFFDDGWKHGRVDHELSKSRQTFENRSAAGKANAYKRHANGKGMANHSEVHSPSPSQLQEETKKETRPRAEKRAPKRVALPDNFPDPELRREAHRYWLSKSRADLAGDVQGQVDQFCDHHQSRGSTMASWPAAWRTWMRNALKFTRVNGNGNARKESSHEQTERIARELIAKENARDQGADFSQGNGSGASLPPLLTDDGGSEGGLARNLMRGPRAPH